MGCSLQGICLVRKDGDHDNFVGFLFHFIIFVLFEKMVIITILSVYILLQGICPF